MDKTKEPKAKRNTKQHIIDAAIDLFSENGASGVSIRDLTKKVGINESSFYNHFKSKDELLDVIIETFKLGLGEASFPIARLEDMLIGMEPELFFQNHLLMLRDRITPTIQKIWKIIYMEQFRDKRARDFVIEEIIGRPHEYYTEAFRLMAKKGQIKPVDPMVLSDELNYGLLALSLERMLLQTDNLDVTLTVKKMFAHIRFMCDSLKI